MTIATIYFPLDMTEDSVVIGTVTFASSSQITIESGSSVFHYYGAFVYDGSGGVTGVTTTFQYYESGVLQQEATQINIDFADLQSAAYLGMQAFFKLLLGGRDTLNGSSGDDILFGFGKNDIIYGNGGDDELYGGAGSDVVMGGGGRDVLHGGNRADQLFGNGGRDKLFGEKGDDYLSGGRGNDKLWGGGGDDLVYGGAGAIYRANGNFKSWSVNSGNDILRGGAGADHFLFTPSAGEGTTAVIKDFTDGVDLLNLSAFGVTTAKQAKAFATNVDGDVVFDFGSGDILTVENIQRADLSAADFSFIDYFG